MAEHRSAPCMKEKHHIWTKWKDSRVPWLYVPPNGVPIRGSRRGQQRQCTRCDKKEVQVTDVFTAADQGLENENAS